MGWICSGIQAGSSLTASVQPLPCWHLPHYGCYWLRCFSVSCVTLAFGFQGIQYTVRPQKTLQTEKKEEGREADPNFINWCVPSLSLRCPPKGVCGKQASSQWREESSQLRQPIYVCDQLCLWDPVSNFEKHRYSVEAISHTVKFI